MGLIFPLVYLSPIADVSWLMELLVNGVGDLLRSLRVIALIQRIYSSESLRVLARKTRAFYGFTVRRVLVCFCGRKVCTRWVLVRNLSKSTRVTWWCFQRMQWVQLRCFGSLTSSLWVRNRGFALSSYFLSTRSVRAAFARGSIGILRLHARGLLSRAGTPLRRLRWR